MVGKFRAGSGRGMIVITVHGTKLVNDNSENVPWYEEKSEFSQSLKAFGDDPGGVKIEPCEWIAPNSRAARKSAGKKLAARIVSLEKGSEPYYLVAHSHGGSVCAFAIRDALRSLPQLRNLAGISTFGTPFIVLLNNWLKDRVFGVRRLFIGIWGFVALLTYYFLGSLRGVPFEFPGASLNTARENLDWSAAAIFTSDHLFWILTAIFSGWAIRLTARDYCERKMSNKYWAVLSSLDEAGRLRSYFHWDDEIIWWLLPLDRLSRVQKRAEGQASEEPSSASSFAEIIVRMYGLLAQQKALEFTIPIFFLATFVGFGIRFVAADSSEFLEVQVLAVALALFLLTLVFAKAVPFIVRTRPVRRHLLAQVSTKTRRAYAEHILGLGSLSDNFAEVWTGFLGSGVMLGDQDEFGKAVRKAANNHLVDLADALRNFAILAGIDLNDAITRIVASRGLIHNCYFEGSSAAVLVSRHIAEVRPEYRLNSEALGAKVSAASLEQLRLLATANGARAPNCTPGNRPR